MPSMTFRFTTECELTLEGQSYEEVYLKFKDLCQQQQPISETPMMKVYPPEDSSIYFEIDEQNTFCEMGMIKGDFTQDILKNLPENWLQRVRPLHRAH